MSRPKIMKQYCHYNTANLPEIKIKMLKIEWATSELRKINVGIKQNTES